MGNKLSRLSSYTRRFVCLILLLLAVLTLPHTALALSDADYHTFMESSPDFVAAESRLNTAWGAAKKSLPETEFADLRDDQRRWISFGRDYMADQLLAKAGGTRAHAYAEVTESRAILIEEYTLPERRTPQSKTGVLDRGGTGAMAVPASLFVGGEPVNLPEDKASWDIILAECKFDAPCNITGVLGISGYFVTVTNASSIQDPDALVDTEAAPHQDVGTPDGWYTLAKKYDGGEDGFPQDHVKAFEWYKKAAEQGHAEAQAQLGYMYEVGRGVSIDSDKSFEWRRKAAEQGNGHAAYILGLRYASGKGVSEDLNMAVEWFKVAIKNGHDAQWDLDNVRTRIDGGDFPCSQFGISFAHGQLLIQTPDFESITTLLFDDTEFTDGWGYHPGQKNLLLTRPLRGVPNKISIIQRNGTMCSWDITQQKQY